VIVFKELHGQIRARRPEGASYFSAVGALEMQSPRAHLGVTSDGQAPAGRRGQPGQPTGPLDQEACRLTTGIGSCPELPATGWEPQVKQVLLRPEV
jgi:hypothetical protein